MPLDLIGGSGGLVLVKMCVRSIAYPEGLVRAAPHSHTSHLDSMPAFMSLSNLPSRAKPSEHMSSTFSPSSSYAVPVHLKGQCWSFLSGSSQTRRMQIESPSWTAFIQ